MSIARTTYVTTAEREELMAKPVTLEPGQKLWNGKLVTPDLAAAYNALTDRIESFKAAGLPVPDQLLNGRHNLIAH